MEYRPSTDSQRTLEETRKKEAKSEVEKGGGTHAFAVRYPLKRPFNSQPVAVSQMDTSTTEY